MATELFTTVMWNTGASKICYKKKENTIHNPYLGADRCKMDLFGPYVEFFHRDILLDLVRLTVQLALDASDLCTN